MNRDSSTAVFCYQGSKSTISEWVVSHFPTNHTKLHYVEPFFGSGSVFFKKPKGNIESISDLNKNIYYFFKALRDDYDSLIHKINNTMWCENTFKDCIDIYTGKNKADNLTKAWATFCYFRLSFGGMGGQFGYVIDDRSGRNKIFNNSIKRLNIFRERIKYVQIFNRKAEWFINKFYKYENAFMYLDPPYPETNQDAYQNSFNMDDFNKMLDKLYKAKFKFALSFYEKEGMELEKFKDSPQYSLIYKNTLSLLSSTNNVKRTECLLINYKSGNQQQGFDI